MSYCYDLMLLYAGIDVEHVVVGIPYPSLESKGGLLDRLRLPAFFNKAPVPDQSAALAKTEIPKAPEPVEATVPDSSPVSASLEAPTTVERATDTAVGSHEGIVRLGCYLSTHTGRISTTFFKPIHIAITSEICTCCLFF